MSDRKVMVHTNIVSYLMRGSSEAKAYARHLKDRLVAISFITVGELYYGAEKKTWGKKKRQQLETILRNFVVIPYDHEIAKTFAIVAVARERLGRRMSFNDAWIAACAVRHNVSLVTHNAKDFVEIDGLEVITECQPV